MALTKKLVGITAKAKEIERSLLGQLIQRPKDVIKTVSIIAESDFQDGNAKKAYGIIKNAVLNEQDVISLLTDGGIRLGEFVSSDYRGVENLAKEIKQLSVSVRFHKTVYSALNQLDWRNIRKAISKLEEDLTRLSAGTSEERATAKEIVRDLEREQMELAAGFAEGRKFIGMESGFRKLDSAIEGIRKGHLWVLGGYTNTGKTALSLNIASNLLSQKKAVVFYSLEMSKIDIATRLLSLRLNVEGNKIMKGLMDEEEYKKFKEEREFLRSSDLKVFTELNGLEEIKFSMIEENMRRKVDCFFVDYLQLIQDERISDEYEIMKKAADGFRALSQKMKVPIIALSQISNEAAKRSSMQILGFKGAGNIASAADLGAELTLNEDAEQALEKQAGGMPIKVRLIIKKNRHGRKGSIAFEFDTAVGKFYEN